MNHPGWTGLTSGHKKPKVIQEAYDRMIDAWAEYTHLCDLLEERLATAEQLLAAKEKAMKADDEYNQTYHDYYSGG